MSTTTSQAIVDDHAPSHADDHEHHPTATTYWLTFVGLVILTAIEVLWSYLPIEGVVLVVPLLVMMVVKFCIVGGVFMHLQTDFKILNGYWFTLAFGIALCLAIAVYVIVYATFKFQI